MQAQYTVNNDLLIGTDIWIDTPQWFDWVALNKGFRYQDRNTNFNCNKRSSGKWYATKKVYSANGSKTVALYIGRDKDCTLAKLKELAQYYALDWKDFWTWYYSPERKESRKGKVTVVPDSGEGEKGTTDTQVLQGELARLQKDLEKMTKDRDDLLIRIAGMQDRMHSEIKSSIAFQDSRLQELENYNRELDRANGYLEKDNAQLLEENYQLKMEVQKLRADAIAPGQQNDESIPTHPWSVGSIQPRSILLRKAQSRRQFEKMGNYPVLMDGSQWRRIGAKHEVEPSEQFIFQGHPANTVFYVCVG